MPVKRRLSKGRKRLDETEIEDLMYGPGTCLFNGLGYLGCHGDGLWRDKSEAVKHAVLSAMRDDWQRHRALILSHWHARDDHDLAIARNYFGSPTEPWAQREFEGTGNGND